MSQLSFYSIWLQNQQVADWFDPLFKKQADIIHGCPLWSLCLMTSAFHFLLGLSDSRGHLPRASSVLLFAPHFQQRCRIAPFPANTKIDQQSDFEGWLSLLIQTNPSNMLSKLNISDEETFQNFIEGLLLHGFNFLVISCRATSIICRSLTIFGAPCATEH